VRGSHEVQTTLKKLPKFDGRTGKGRRKMGRFKAGLKKQMREAVWGKSWNRSKERERGSRLDLTLKEKNQRRDRWEGRTGKGSLISRLGER